MVQSMKKALIVDGGQDAVSEIDALLQSLHFHVTVLEESSQAEAALGKCQYEVIVLNRELPGSNWWQSLDAVKTAASESAVILMARSPTETDMRDALSAGAYRALGRPLKARHLSGLISHNAGGVLLVLRG